MNQANTILGEIYLYARGIGEQAGFLSQRNLAIDDRSLRIQLANLKDHAETWRKNMKRISELLDQLEALE